MSSQSSLEGDYEINPDEKVNFLNKIRTNFVCHFKIFYILSNSFKFFGFFDSTVFCSFFIGLSVIAF